FHPHAPLPSLPSFPTRRSSDLSRFARHCSTHAWSRFRHASTATWKSSRQFALHVRKFCFAVSLHWATPVGFGCSGGPQARAHTRSEEHTSELQSRENLVCRLLL